MSSPAVFTERDSPQTRHDAGGCVRAAAVRAAGGPGGVLLGKEYSAGAAAGGGPKEGKPGGEQHRAG